MANGALTHWNNLATKVFLLIGLPNTLILMLEVGADG